MTDLVLNILTFGIRPLYKKQGAFNDLITEFRKRFANPGRYGLIEEDVDEFYKKLNNFNFSYVLFKGYYRDYIENLNRFMPEAEGDVPDLTFLRIALTENKWKPTKPWPVFLYHIRYRFPLTSKPIVSYQKMQYRKKLDAPGAIAERDGSKKSSQQWTRVPISRNQSKANP